MKTHILILRIFKVFLQKPLMQVPLLLKKRKKRSQKILYHVNKIIRSSEELETGKLDLINKQIHQLNLFLNNLPKAIFLKERYWNTHLITIDIELPMLNSEIKKNSHSKIMMTYAELPKFIDRRENMLKNSSSLA